MSPIISPTQAVQLLKQGTPVALPTETVYGLAAPIHLPEAIKKVFRIKSRPFFDPLIVHVSAIEQAKKLVTWWPAEAELLTKEFWPGPLTLVLPKKNVDDLITSGLETVGLRIPQHPLFLEVLNGVGHPLAAPSANLFGQTSPTTAQHVMSELKDVSVVDGGPCVKGLESTVLRIINTSPVVTFEILRMGPISKKEIQKALDSNKVIWASPSDIKHSPGHTKHHYMPQVPFVISLLKRTEPELREALKNQLQNIPDTIEGVSIRKPKNFNTIGYLDLPTESSVAARVFYAELRRIASSGCDFIVFFKDKIHDRDEWNALIERATKAASLVF